MKLSRVALVLLWAPAVMAAEEHNDSSFSLANDNGNKGKTMEEVRAAADLTVASTLQSLKTSDPKSRVKAFEGAVEGLEVLSEEIESMEDTGLPFLDSILKSTKSSLENFFQEAPTVLRFMRSTVKDDDKELQGEDDAATMVRGRRNLKDEPAQDDGGSAVHGMPQDNHHQVDQDLRTGTHFEAETIAKKPTSRGDDKKHKENRGHIHQSEYNRQRRAHSFQNNRLASHRHEHLNNLQDAILGGDHHHLGKVLGSVRSKVDGPTVSGLDLGRRRLTAEDDKAAQCHQLVMCSKGISFYDSMAYFYSDDIDPATGELDGSIIHFDEERLEDKHDLIKALATDLYETGGDVPAKYTDAKVNAVKVFSDKTLCMDAETTSPWNVRMTACHHGLNQQFRFNPATLAIETMKWGAGSGCLGIVDGGSNVAAMSCDGSYRQQWHLTSKHELKSTRDARCLEWTGSNLEMKTCDDGNNQKFTLPAGYNPTKYSSPGVFSVKTTYELMKCLHVDAGSYLKMDWCHYQKNQLFTYDRSTKQIRSLSRSNSECMDVANSSGKWWVKMASCDSTSNTQKWERTDHGELKVMEPSWWNWCLEWTAPWAEMKPCDNSLNYQQFSALGESVSIKDPPLGIVKVDSAPNLCMTMDGQNGNKLLMGECLKASNQLYFYDPVNWAIEIPAYGGCMEVESNLNVKIGTCGVKTSQQWELTIDNELKARSHADKCLTLVGTDLKMTTCNQGSSQKFTTGPTDIIPKRYSLCKHNPTPNKCGVGKQQEYRGTTVSVTETGKTCKAWGPDDPFTPQGYPNDGLVSNYCRNPGGSGDRAWCYTTDPSTRWEYCDVPRCKCMSSNSKCDDLLQQFHRNVEFDGVPHWEGGTVSQVCLAEGSQTFIRVDEVALKLGSYYAKKVADEIFHCSKDLYNSGARINRDEPFPFSNVANPTTPSQLVIPTGLNLANRDQAGMITDITKPAYTMSAETAHTSITSAANDLQTIYSKLWFHVSHANRMDHFEAGAYEPHQSYQAASDWKNKYFRADKALEMLQFIVDDRPPPGSRGSYLLTNLKTAMAAMNAAETSFTGDDKAYAKKLLKEGTASLIGTFKSMQHGYDLVFGDKTSVGFMCGIRDAVRRGGAAKWPGTCCLAPPFQNTGDNWGRKYDCNPSTTCPNPGPFFAGIHEESCSAAGGTWCPKPADCSVLKTCLQALYDKATSEKKVAFASYLKGGLVKNANKAGDCGSAREYFGYDALYTNDNDICENVAQLHNTKNFGDLDKVYGQGTELPATGVELPETGQHSWVSLKKPDRARSAEEAVKDSKEWKTANFAISQSLDTVDAILQALIAIKCPDDVTGGLQTTCSITVNTIFGITQIVFVLIRLAFAIVDFTMHMAADETDEEAAQVVENVAVLYYNNDVVNVNMKAVYDDVDKVHDKVALVDGYFKDGDTLVTMPILKNAIEQQCGPPPSTRGRALQVEDPAPNEESLASTARLEAMVSNLEQQVEALNSKLEHQVEAMNVKLKQQVDAMNARFDQQQSQYDAMMKEIRVLSTISKQLLDQRQAVPVQEE